MVHTKAMVEKPTLVDSHLQIKPLGQQNKAKKKTKHRNDKDIHNLHHGDLAGLVLLFIMLDRLGHAVRKDAHQAQEHRQLEDPARNQKS